VKLSLLLEARAGRRLHANLRCVRTLDSSVLEQKGVQGLARGMAAAGFLGAAGATMWQNRAFTAAAPVALSPSEFRSFKCVDIEKLTPNTFKYTFELPGGAVPGLTVASCLMCKTEIDGSVTHTQTHTQTHHTHTHTHTHVLTVASCAGKEVARPYTPISGDEKPGAMDLVVKVYDQGKVSKAFGNMQVGDSMAMKGPFKKFEYKPNEKKEIGMIAGGSGITPMYQVSLTRTHTHTHTHQTRTLTGFPDIYI